MTVSFSIVNLNSESHLYNCIKVLPESISDIAYEIIVVDNGSRDQSIQMLREHYPLVRIIKNLRNEGYTKAINMSLRESIGDMIVLLNPDTIPQSGASSKMIEYMVSNSKVGICGPKVLNMDGSFQKSCRRGIARPWAVFSYFFGLSRIYPDNVRFTGYHLDHLDENMIAEVGGVSGSCMVIRREVINQIGYFDERYFAYQEDSDYCLRASEKGWSIIYNPHSVIYHIGGAGGSNSYPMRSIFEWHRSYYFYYQKHFAEDYPTLFNYFYSLLMFIKLIIAEGKDFLYR
ncbi:uncharacterized protein METZ01_LOCUS184670 [marine metagenome]|uniref:Glycosyltransferase 2-like domain-containing protein n=1 Tax=marine metagenome TaxID=408172 RepID=A0A382CZZ9_9ZZZZ